MFNLCFCPVKGPVDTNPELLFLLSICAALMDMNKQGIMPFCIDLLLTYCEAVIIQ